jgi:predicted KAP-like P-loop ATPase
MAVMKITTFSEDLFGLSCFAERIEKFIKIEHEYVEGGLVVALSSKFGSGKTTFLQMWKSKMEESEEESDKPFVISLNAWESDYYGDPLFAIISSLVDCLQERGKSADTLIEAAKDFGWFTTAIGRQIAKKMSGIDPLEAGKFAEKKKTDRNSSFNHLPLDTFSIYQGRKEAMTKLKETIQNFVTASEPKVLFLVDELDRCRPDYAISYLETIKHIFDIKGAVFILAADRQQLANSAKTAFGPDLDFEEYYRKFIHREITLPPISNSGYSKLVSAYVSHYLERDNTRNCFMTDLVIFSSKTAIFLDSQLFQR